METSEKKGILIVPVGVPGCGKSTLAETFKKTKNAVVISSDSIREEFFGNADLQYTKEFGMERIRKKRIDISDKTEEEIDKLIRNLCSKAVWGTMNFRTMKALKEGKIVVYDATNINTRTRERILENFKAYYEKAIAYYFDVSVETAKIRNSKRSRVVPNEVIDNMYKKLSKPSKEEGFDEIRIITD